MASPNLVDMASRTTPMAKKGWIKKATSKNKGKFAAKAAAAGKTTREYAQEHAGDGGTLGKEAVLATTLLGMNHKRKSIYGHPSSKRMNG